MEYWYYGLADCHGVESFVLTNSDAISKLFFDADENQSTKDAKFALCLRAHANQQRHAVVYMVLLDEEDSIKVDKAIAEERLADALTIIKTKAKDVKLGTWGTTLSAAAKNWDMIPNPALDPYHTS
jgi:hypothetical protein